MASPIRLLAARRAPVRLAPAALLSRVAVAPLVQPATPMTGPMLNMHVGQAMYQDVKQDNLWWYTPAYGLAPDADAAFSFAAAQTGVDASGNPFSKGRVTLGLTQSVPSQVNDFQAKFHVQVREIGLVDMMVSLEVAFKDAKGADATKSLPGALQTDSSGHLIATFDNIVGPAVILAYENLATSGGATVRISARYDAWLSNLQPVSPPPGTVSPPPFTYSPQTFSVMLPLNQKYTSAAYALKYTVASGNNSHPIVDVNDLRDFDTRRSEFSEMKSLGTVNQRYPSLKDLYIGVVSRTIMVIPAQYTIVRTLTGLGASCDAVVDPGAGGDGKCKFEFSFLVAPDVSPIDIAQLCQDMSRNDALHDYTISWPTSLKDGGHPRVPAAFDSSVSAVEASNPNSFELSMEIRDQGADTPAVANANLLIEQLSAANEPVLLGTLDLKLDDFYPDPVQSGLTLSFQRTSAWECPDELAVTIEEAAQSMQLANRSVFDLRLSRYATLTSQGLSVTPADRVLAANGVLQAPLPPAHDSIRVLADRDIEANGPVKKADIARYLTFRTKNVQNTQYVIGINASGVNFEGRGIASLEVNVVLTDLPEIPVPKFSLERLKTVNSTSILIPIQNAISSLQATVQFVLHYADAGKAEVSFTITHEFIGDPILILLDANVDSAGHS